jgi:hypothetical protein
MQPEIDYYTVFAVTDNARGTVEVLEKPLAAAA